MPAPSTITVTGTWVTPLNAPATGHVTFQPVDRAINNTNIITTETLQVDLVAGAISAVLVELADYVVVEYIDGTVAKSYPIVGTDDLALDTIVVT